MHSGAGVWCPEVDRTAEVDKRQVAPSDFIESVGTKSCVRMGFDRTLVRRSERKSRQNKDAIQEDDHNDDDDINDEGKIDIDINKKPLPLGASVQLDGGGGGGENMTTAARLSRAGHSSMGMIEEDGRCQSSRAAELRVAPIDASSSRRPTSRRSLSPASFPTRLNNELDHKPNHTRGAHMNKNKNENENECKNKSSSFLVVSSSADSFQSIAVSLVASSTPTLTPSAPELVVLNSQSSPRAPEAHIIFTGAARERTSLPGWARFSKLISDFNRSFKITSTRESWHNPINNHIIDTGKSTISSGHVASEAQATQTSGSLAQVAVSQQLTSQDNNNKTRDLTRNSNSQSSSSSSVVASGSSVELSSQLGGARNNKILNDIAEQQWQANRSSSQNDAQSNHESFYVITTNDAHKKPSSLFKTLSCNLNRRRTKTTTIKTTTIKTSMGCDHNHLSNTSSSQALMLQGGKIMSAASRTNQIDDEITSQIYKHNQKQDTSFPKIRTKDADNSYANFQSSTSSNLIESLRQQTVKMISRRFNQPPPPPPPSSSSLDSPPCQSKPSTVETLIKTGELVNDNELQSPPSTTTHRQHEQRTSMRPPRSQDMHSHGRTLSGMRDSVSKETAFNLDSTKPSESIGLETTSNPNVKSPDIGDPSQWGQLTDQIANSSDLEKPRLNDDCVSYKGRDVWAKNIEFLLAVIGFAVDLGNVWRFPYVCYKNGGGAFLIPYTILFVFGGLPIFYLEMSLGQYFSSGCLTVWKRVCPMAKGIGYSMCLLNFFTGLYYNTIISWAVFFFIESFQTNLPWTSCNNSWNTDKCKSIGQRQYSISHLDLSHTNKTTISPELIYSSNSTTFTSPTKDYFDREVLQIHMSSGINDLGAIRKPLALYLAVVFVCIYFAIWKGVRSTGKAVWITALLPYFILIPLLFRGVFLEGAWSGIKYYLSPQWDSLINLNVWVEAAKQIYFSLGPGFGTLMALSSYNKFHHNTRKDALIAAAVNYFASFIAGFVIFAVLGYMSFMGEVDISKVAKEGPGLVFEVYPEGLATMQFSALWSVLFFTMVITLGIDSTFGGLESVITGLCDEYPRVLRAHRGIFIGILIVIIYLCSLPTTTNGGKYVIFILESYGTSSLLLIVLVETIVVCWVYGTERFCANLEEMSGRQPSPYWRMCWKYISPTILLIIFMAACVEEIGKYYVLKDDNYTYPDWAPKLGLLITGSSIICMPIYAIYHLIFKTTGSLSERWSSAWKPDLSDQESSPEATRDHEADGEKEREFNSAIGGLNERKRRNANHL